MTLTSTPRRRSLPGVRWCRGLGNPQGVDGHGRVLASEARTVKVVWRLWECGCARVRVCAKGMRAYIAVGSKKSRIELLIGCIELLSRRPIQLRSAVSSCCLVGRYSCDRLYRACQTATAAACAPTRRRRSELGARGAGLHLWPRTATSGSCRLLFLLYLGMTDIEESGPAGDQGRHGSRVAPPSPRCDTINEGVRCAARSQLSFGAYLRRRRHRLDRSIARSRPGHHYLPRCIVQQQQHAPSCMRVAGSIQLYCYAIGTVLILVCQTRIALYPSTDVRVTQLYCSS